MKQMRFVRGLDKKGGKGKKIVVLESDSYSSTRAARDLMELQLWARKKGMQQNYWKKASNTWDKFPLLVKHMKPGFRPSLLCYGDRKLGEDTKPQLGSFWA